MFCKPLLEALAQGWPIRQWLFHARYSPLPRRYSSTTERSKLNHCAKTLQHFLSAFKDRACVSEEEGTSEALTTLEASHFFLCWNAQTRAVTMGPGAGGVGAIYYEFLTGQSEHPSTALQQQKLKSRQVVH